MTGRSSKPLKRWTAEQTKALLDGVGSFGWSVLERRTGHNKKQILEKIRREFGGGGITRGSYTLAQAMAETGYSRTQLFRARAALLHRWTRTARGGHYLIASEQLEELVEWLRADFWSVKHHLYKCADCATIERPHLIGGLCGACYARLRIKARAYGMTKPTPKRFLLILNSLPRDHTSPVEWMFLDQVRGRLEAGRLPSLVEWERVISVCTSKQH